jgi:hypothetical protein
LDGASHGLFVADGWEIEIQNGRKSYTEDRERRTQRAQREGFSDKGAQGDFLVLIAVK